VTKPMLITLTTALVVLAMGAAAPSFAQGAGGIGGVKIGAPSGLQANPGPSMNMGLPPVFNIQRTPQRFRDLNLAGRVGVDVSKLPPDAKVVRLHLDGREIPMRLDTEFHSAELQFEPEASYGRDLYRAILTKRVEVVGAANLRGELQSAAEHGRQAEVEGYVFDLSSPYLVLKSVKQTP
jgi:hypothetical protein